MSEPTAPAPSLVLTRDTKLTPTEVIREVASILFPEDGHETTLENDMSSVFQLLCEATRVYSTMDPNRATDLERENAYTLVSVAENVCPSMDLHV